MVKKAEVVEPEVMQELVIDIEGHILESNLGEWKDSLLARVASSKRELKTEDDFVHAALDIKTLKEGEKSLATAKEKALKKAADVYNLFAAIDEISEEARLVRLALEKQIKLRKAEIVRELLKAGKSEMEELLEMCPPEYVESEEGRRVLTGYESQANDAIKGKKTTSTIKAAIDKVVGTITSRVLGKSELIKANLKLLDAYVEGGHAALLSDRSALSFMDADDMEAEIKRRIQQHAEAQAEKDNNKQKTIDAQAGELEVRRAAAADKKPEAKASPVVESGGTAKPPLVPVIKDQPQAEYQLMINITTDIETFKGLARTIQALGQQYLAYKDMTIDAGKKPAKADA